MKIDLSVSIKYTQSICPLSSADDVFAKAVERMELLGELGSLTGHRDILNFGSFSTHITSVSLAIHHNDLVPMLDGLLLANREIRTAMNTDPPNRLVELARKLYNEA